jgi:3'(2'), 5'-bisphosphate nucleotidase
LIELKPILDAVRQAAVVTRRIRENDMGAREKGAQDPVTLADYAAQVILCRAIARAFPDDAILGEERGSVFDTTLDPAGQEIVAREVSQTLGETLTVDQARTWLDHGRDRGGDRLWTVDPIDGTKGYIAGRRYAIALALLIDSLPVAGIIGAPDPEARDGGVVFYGQRSAAYFESLAGGKATRVAVSAQTDTRKWRAVESFEKSHGNFSRPAQVYASLGISTANVGNFDSQVKYAMVACGDAELFLRFPRDENWVNLAWDHAPGVALLQAAGGVVTDLDGSLIDFSTGAKMSNNKGVVATNGTAHEKVLEVVQTAMNTNG